MTAIAEMGFVKEIKTFSCCILQVIFSQNGLSYIWISVCMAKTGNCVLGDLIVEETPRTISRFLNDAEFIAGLGTWRIRNTLNKII